MNLDIMVIEAQRGTWDLPFQQIPELSAKNW